MENVKFQIEKLNAEFSTDRKWDEFLCTIDEPPIEQFSAWGYARKGTHMDVYRALIILDDEIYGGTQFFEYHHNRLGKFISVPQGPCLKNIHSYEYSNFLIESIKQYVRQRKINYVVWDVNHACNGFSKLLKPYGYTLKPKIIPPHPIIEGTLMLHLEDDLQEIFKGFKRVRKRNITAGLKDSSISVRLGKREDIELFFHLMLSMCDRANRRPIPDNINFFYQLWDHLEPIGGVVLHIAEYNNEAICCIFGLALGNTYRALKWGWNGALSETNITHVIYWKTIEWAKNNGFEYYDFVQVDPEIAQLIEAGAEISSEMKQRGFYGSTVNKMRYAGKVIYYPGTYIYYNNLLLKLLGWILKFLTKNRYFKKIIDYMVVKTMHT